MGCVRYFMTFIDGFSKKIWLYALKSKGECFEKFKEFKALVEMQSEHKIKVFQLENGIKYISKAFKRFLKDYDIGKQMSMTYRPQQNGMVKYANLIIVEIARSMLYAQNLYKSFLSRRCGQCSLHMKSMSNKGIKPYYA